MLKVPEGDMAALIKARSLIAEHWTQGTFARSADGDRLAPEYVPEQRRWFRRSIPAHIRWLDRFTKEERTPDSFCALGALTQVTSERWTVAPWDGSGYLSAREFLALAALERGWEEITLFNDDVYTKHEDVLALFDRAIEIAARATVVA